jgi:hypothetical protein
VDRRQLKKIIAPIVLVGAILIGGRLLTSSRSLAKVTIHYRLGDRAAHVSELIARVHHENDSETAGSLDTKIMSSDVVEHDRLKPGSYVVDITIIGDDGSHTHVTRSIDVPSGGGDITIDLSN